MKLEVGKEYRARNGEKVRIVARKYGGYFMFISSIRDEYSSSGKHGIAKHDLISEWDEETMTTETEIKKLGELPASFQAGHAAEQGAAKAIWEFAPVEGEQVAALQKEVAELKDEYESMQRMCDSTQERLDRVVLSRGAAWKEVKELKAQVAECCPAKKGGVFVPEDYEDYFYRDDRGHVYRDTWEDADLDRDRLAIGNCYRTREEADQVVTNRKIHRFLQEQTDFVADWDDDNQAAYFLIYEHDQDLFSYDYWWNRLYGTQAYFRNREDLETARDKAIEEFGRENVKSYATAGVM